MAIKQKLKYLAFGLPLWSILILAPLVLGAVYLAVSTVNITSKEPLSFTVLPTTMALYPAEQRNITVSIENVAPISYGLIVSNKVTGLCLVQFLETDGTGMALVNASLGEFNLNSGTGTIIYRVTLPADAGAGAGCSISTDVIRQAVFQ